MARGKKTKKELTQEEWLERALVPEEEWPYRVPGNWRWVKLGQVIELISGRDVPISKCNDQGLGVPYILGASNIENNSFMVERWIETPQVISKKNDILISVKGTIGKLYIQKEDSINISRQIMAIRSNKNLRLMFVYFFLQHVCNELREAGNGLIPGISRSDILEKTFPLPPFVEQQRIVERIESLFTKLDKVKEKVQVVVDGFEQRKSAILHKAFTGELTEQWRKKNGHSISKWEECRVSDFCKSLKYGTAKKSKKEGSVVVIRMGNLQNGEIEWKNLAYTDDADDIKKYCLNLGDVLFNRTNSPELVGKTAIYRGEFPAIYAGYLIKLEYDETIIGGYLNYVLNSPQAKKYCNMVKTDGVNQSNINAKKIGAFKISRPSIGEQMEIVRILDGFFFKETLTKKKIEAILKSIDLIKKSILAKAFRGELGTNDPTEESAKELLKRVYMDNKG